MRKFLGSILVVSGIVLGSIYFINNYVSTEIEKILLEKLKENPDLDIRYGKVNFTIIPLKLTFDTVILKQEDLVIKSDQLSLSGWPEELPSKDDINEGKFKLSFSDLEVDLIGFSVGDNDNKINIDQVKSNIGVDIDFEGQTFIINKLSSIYNGVNALGEDDNRFSLSSGRYYFEGLLDGDNLDNSYIETIEIAVESFDFENQEILLEIESGEFNAEGYLSSSDNYQIESLMYDINGINLSKDGRYIGALQKSKLDFIGNINTQKNIYNLNSFRVAVQNLDSPIGEEDFLQIKNGEIDFTANQAVYLDRLETENLLTNKENYTFKFFLEDYSFPRILSRELDLDDFGIDDIYGSLIKGGISKNNTNADVDFEIRTPLLGNIRLNGGYDFSLSKTNPQIDVSIQLEDVNREVRRLIRMTGLRFRDENGILKFTYNGELEKLFY